MTEKIPCKYCGMKYHPRQIKRHEQQCKDDQKGGAIKGKPKLSLGVGILMTCQKCGSQTVVLKLDGSKCKECGADL